MHCSVRIWRTAWRHRKKSLFFVVLLAFFTILGNVVVIYLQSSGLEESVKYRLVVKSSVSGKDVANSNVDEDISRDNYVVELSRVTGKYSSSSVRLYGVIPDHSVKATAKVPSPKLYAKLAKTTQLNVNQSILEYNYYRKRDWKVNEYNYSIILSPKPLCFNDTYMIILIHSFHPRIERRKAIRSTWTSVARTNGSWPGIGPIRESMRAVFILGLHPDPGLNEVAREESERYEDIVVGNFNDSYRNMTLKSLLGLKLVREQCSSVKYLLKSDDDMFINIPYLIDILNTRQPLRAIMGPYIADAKVRRNGKWCLTREEFPMEKFPPYEAGAAYLITGDIVSELFETAEYVPQIFIDDVYVTGIIGRILNVTHVRQDGFAFANSKIPKACDVILRNIVSGTKASPQVLTQIWAELRERDIQRNYSCIAKD